MSAEELELYCNCHGTETMVKLREGKLLFRRKIHGEYHTLALPVDNIPKLVLELGHYGGVSVEG